MRKIGEIQTDLDAALEGYRAVANEAPPAAIRERVLAVKGLQAELAAALSDGAKVCARCGTVPHGMLRAPAAGRVPAIYEVGCTSCPASAQGLTPAGAVEAWNTVERA